MKYVDEFRDRRIIDKLAGRIRGAVDKGRTYNIMEVCGTHTMNIFRFGLKDILPENINLISGPGCPVCVTPNDFIDKAIRLAGSEDVIIATFGDMMRVPGSASSLEKEKASGSDVRMVYSTSDALGLAKKNPRKEIIFLGIGFETTAPTVAQSILTAQETGVKNYSVLSGHKTMPEVMEALLKDRSIAIDGFLLPGHVSTIIGKRPYEFLAKEHHKRCVIAGFEPADILESILMLITQKEPAIKIEYTRIVSKSGNRLAQKTIERVFQKTTSRWRGLGEIKNSGLKIRDEYSAFDADKKFRPKATSSEDTKGCICGEVLRGIRTPLDCKLFGKRCKPDHPVGACMVSSEGTCAAYYRYSR